MEEKPYYKLTTRELAAALSSRGIQIESISDHALHLRSRDEMIYLIRPINRELRYIGLDSTQRIPDHVVTISELTDYLNSEKMRMEIAKGMLDHETDFLFNISENIDAWMTQPLLLDILKQYSPRSVAAEVGRALLLRHPISTDQGRSFYEETQKERPIIYNPWLSLLLTSLALPTSDL